MRVKKLRFFFKRAHEFVCKEKDDLVILASSLSLSLLLAVFVSLLKERPETPTADPIMMQQQNTPLNTTYKYK
jgi:hypothetical protein